ncbi:hypothetical protein AAFF_G00066890 [Aldrovandia affinis]|uniref:PH and SEC7 domain-containing protein 4-like n=1 Tax=Aldrovandia affinis TaxID=143900 RepID=A0AAD7T489_9TELE|nr:hypothetical protein AAFF_G00066890 [Aldrovandia affinis]
MMEEDPGRVLEPDQRDTIAHVPEAPWDYLEHQALEKKLEEGEEEDEDGAHWEVTGNGAPVDAGLLTLPSMPLSLCSSESGPLAVPVGDMPDCRGGASLDTDPPLSRYHLHPLCPVGEGSTGSLTELDIPKETGVPASSSSCLDPRNAPQQGCGEEEPVTASKEEECSASGPREDAKEVDPEVPPTEPLAGESHEATEGPGQETPTPSGGEIKEGCSLAIRTVAPPTQEGAEEGEEAASLAGHEEVAKKGEEEEKREEEEREEHNYLVHNNVHRQSIREQEALVENVEEMDRETDLTELCEQTGQTVQLNQTEQSEHKEQPRQMEQPEPMEQSEQRGQSRQREQSGHREQPRQMEQPEQMEQSEQRDPLEQLEQSGEGEQPEQPDQVEQTNQAEQTGEPGHLGRADEPASSQMEGPEDSGQAKQSSPPMPTVTLSQQTAQMEHRETNGGCADRKGASRLAERLYQLQDVRRTDVVKHLDKDNEFSRTVGEEYLKFFEFTGQNLDQGLRSFLKVVVLIGETQERERVLAHFSHRFHQCNPDSFSTPGAVLTLTCAVMLLNTDLHGQNVGKAMSMSSFVSNLDGMNEGENFGKDLLKGLYNTIKNKPLEWAVDEEELKSSMVLPGDEGADALLRSKSNPFQDVPHDKKASVYKQGFLTRKAHADIDGKRTPWGKRSWKTFYAVLKGMVLYLQKDEYKVEWQSSSEVVSVHHALAERAEDYTKRPHVFRLQTADWRVFLFQASTVEQMSSWIYRINLVSALYSSPPFPAAVGSQKRFSRPILPAVQSALTLEKQLQSHSRMLDSFSDDLALLQQPPPEGRRAKARELDERRQREEYLLHEKSRYEVYKQMLEVWKDLGGGVGGVVGAAELERFDGELCMDLGQEEEAAGLKKSHSSPSLNLELASPPIVKVKRNVSERRTYRKIIIPRRNREL